MTANTNPTTRPGRDELEPTPIEGLRVGDLVRRTNENYAGAPVGVVIAVHDATEDVQAWATVRMPNGGEWSGTERAWTVVGIAYLSDDAPDDDTGRLVAAARLQASIREAEAAVARLTDQRDDLFRTALTAGDAAGDLAAACGLSRSRVYQVRDRRR